MVPEPGGETFYICASILSVMSKVEPFGTWQKAYKDACPRGARLVEETLLGEQHKEPLGVFPRATAASPGGISSDVLRAEVDGPGRAALLRFPGDRAV